ncbi:MAG: RNA-binding protein [Chloroflexi bacterium]|nr:RNA-binding protein [Chloroflexota bacterium]
MGKKLFVGSLAWETDSSGLKTAFERFGDIEEATVISDRETGRSRGFGFVTFTEEGPVQQAISEMDGSDLDGRPIVVNEAKEQAPRSGGGGGGYRGGGGGGGDRGDGGGGDRDRRERW